MNLNSLRETECKLSVPLPRAEFRERSFSYNEAALWNTFKIDLLQAQTLQAFSTEIKPSDV